MSTPQLLYTSIVPSANLVHEPLEFEPESWYSLRIHTVPIENRIQRNHGDESVTEVTPAIVSFPAALIVTAP